MTFWIGIDLKMNNEEIAANQTHSCVNAEFLHITFTVYHAVFEASSNWRLFTLVRHKLSIDHLSESFDFLFVPKAHHRKRICLAAILENIAAECSCKWSLTDVIGPMWQNVMDLNTWLKYLFQNTIYLLCEWSGHRNVHTPCCSIGWIVLWHGNGIYSRWNTLPVPAFILGEWTWTFIGSSWRRMKLLWKVIVRIGSYRRLHSLLEQSNCRSLMYEFCTFQPKFSLFVHQWIAKKKLLVYSYTILEWIWLKMTYMISYIFFLIRKINIMQLETIAIPLFHFGNRDTSVRRLRMGVPSTLTIITTAKIHNYYDKITEVRINTRISWIVNSNFPRNPCLPMHEWFECTNIYVWLASLTPAKHTIYHAVPCDAIP